MTELAIPSKVNLSEVTALYEVLALEEARSNFWKYRQYLNPRMVKGWFQREVALALQQFYVDWKAGLKPILLLQTPPQHGKSHSVIDFLSWAAGLDPEAKIIYGSYSDRLGIRANLRLQRTFDSIKYKRLFPKTAINDSNVVTLAGRKLRNHEIIEFLNTEGSFRNTTVSGPVTGESLDLGVIDDPIKGRAEASSPTIREKTWSWMTDDFYSRFSENGGLIMIMTRWHLDDPAGRVIAELPNVRVLRYPAIAEKDEPNRKKGEPLFPQFKSLDFLEKRKSVMTKSGWESVYQQNPIIVGGDMFPVEKFRIDPQPPNKKDIRYTVRYWDKAATEGGDGAFSCGVLIHDMNDGTSVISDVRRGRWSASNREIRIKQTAEIDRSTWGYNMETWIEREPGSGGKESAELTIINLKGHNVKEDRVTGKKEVRAEPYAAQVQHGNVRLVLGPWNQEFIDEHEVFPNGPQKDQVDAAAGAFMKASNKSMYDASLKWVG